jgi:hypothetical protein
MTIETKYNIGDEVWLMWYNKPVQTQVKQVKTLTKEVYKFCIKIFKETTIEYVIKEDSALIPECKLFPTKEEWLNSL